MERIPIIRCPNCGEEISADEIRQARKGAGGKLCCQECGTEIAPAFTLHNEPTLPLPPPGIDTNPVLKRTAWHDRQSSARIQRNFHRRVRPRT